jgi:hypothetical protein
VNAAFPSIEYVRFRYLWKRRAKFVDNAFIVIVAIWTAALLTHPWLMYSPFARGDREHWLAL